MQKAAAGNTTGAGLVNIYLIGALAVAWFVLAGRIYRSHRSIGMALLAAGVCFCLFGAGYGIGKARALQDNAGKAMQAMPQALHQAA